MLQITRPIFIKIMKDKDPGGKMIDIYLRKTSCSNQKYKTKKKINNNINNITTITIIIKQKPEQYYLNKGVLLQRISIEKELSLCRKRRLKTGGGVKWVFEKFVACGLF